MQATFNDLRLSCTDEGRGLPLLFFHGFEQPDAFNSLLQQFLQTVAT